MPPKVVAIHQPQYLPWVPYFDKILRSDLFIFLDNVQFQKNGLQNRNQIKTADGPIWLTVPVKHHLGQPIRETEIADRRFAEKHRKSLEQNYRKSPYFEEVYPLLRPSLEKERNNDLCSLNMELILAILRYLGYKGEILAASRLEAEGKGSDLVLGLCKKAGAPVYLSGPGGRNYMKLEDFSKSGIDVVFQEYRGVEYPQLFPEAGFLPNLSAVDLLFNVGPRSREVIERGRV